MGLQYSIVAYTIYVLLILSYVAQLCTPPQEAFEAEAEALRDLIPGPGNWCVMNDLWHMADHFGQPRNLPSLRQVCMAAQKRVHSWENHAQGGLNILDCSRDLKHSTSYTNHLDRLVRWNRWYVGGPVNVLCSNSGMLDGMGLTTAVLCKKRAGMTSIQLTVQMASA